MKVYRDSRVAPRGDEPASFVGNLAYEGILQIHITEGPNLLVLPGGGLQEVNVNRTIFYN